MYSNGGLPGQILQDHGETAKLEVGFDAVPARDVDFIGLPLNFFNCDWMGKRFMERKSGTIVCCIRA
jgi:hypothetical protein